MGENKEYVSQQLDNGTVHISEDVVAATAAMAVLEIEGVCGLASGVSAKRGSGKGIRVAIAADDSISIDCYVIVLYGYSVIEIAKTVQEAVSTAVESTTGRTVAHVNVSISGISLPKTAKK